MVSSTDYEGADHFTRERLQQPDGIQHSLTLYRLTSDYIFSV